MKPALVVILVALWLCGCARELPQAPEDPCTTLCYTIGTWNIEHLNDSQTRGFPEFFAGGPLYPARSNSDYHALADAIGQELEAVILVLNEVNAEAGLAAGDLGRSEELDRLLHYLGSGYSYVVSVSGGAQNVAILWDRTRARLDTVLEISYPETRVGGADLFPRDPLVAKFTLLSAGLECGDLLIVGLHLASGKARTSNHDSALALLVDTLSALRNGDEGPLSGELDIVLAGDLNFDCFDLDHELYLEQMTAGDWDLLAEVDYPFTRLGGVPLLPASRLDYLICTDVMRGGREILTQRTATVHGELAAGGYDTFRSIYSDHLPVTVRVELVPDDD